MDATDASSPRFRTATPADLPAVERLLEEAGLPTAGIAEIFAANAADFIVAEDLRGGDLVAVAGLEVCADDALLRSVTVRPEWRARGLGEELVRRVVDTAESRGLRALYLLTMTAEHYFPRFGFERVAREEVPDDVQNTGEFRTVCPDTAVAMVKPLGS